MSPVADPQSADAMSSRPQQQAKLPPGMVLDENGKPCKVCNSWQTWAKATKKKTNATASTSDSPSQAAAGTSGSAASQTGIAGTLAAGLATSTLRSEATPERSSDCPPDVNALGRATWTFLHTTAAYYPVQASSTQQTSMRSLLQSVGMFYPCSYCATDFRERMKAVEPDVTGRAGLSKWLCERHNEVNERLGKSSFDCDKVDERWKDGPADGSCD
jgi:FAD-linked sulfhydryl oxidase